MNVRCKVDSCCYCIDGECDLEEITVSDNEMTAAGFQPICQDYDEGLISKAAERLMELSEERADERNRDISRVDKK